MDTFINISINSEVSSARMSMGDIHIDWYLWCGLT